jgi:N-acyl-D-amino-acid deacylase
MEKAHDVPDGKGGNTWRFTRQAMPPRLTLVNGEPTFENGEFTGNKPGLFLPQLPMTMLQHRLQQNSSDDL